jgi:siderophore synthetase component
MNCEHELAVAVIGTLLREDYGGLSRRVRQTPDGPVLDLPAGPVLPLEPDGFLADFRIAPAAPPLALRHMDALLTEICDPRDADGVVAFGAECRHALAALRLRDRHPPAAGPAASVAPRSWLGPAGALRYDAVAAATPHPAYPTWAARTGFTGDDVLRYAPEHQPEFQLRWAAIPRTALVRAGRDRPAWWPDPAAVGLRALADTHDLLPVHPVTARDVLAGTAHAVLAPAAALRVRPTLSTRTVAVTCDPRAHLKLPLPVSTLGLRNQRAIAPATLADGALVHRVLATLTGTDPALGRLLLLADDGSYAHARHRFLGYLLRTLPGGLDGCHMVPVAALLAPADGRTVIENLADGCVLTFAARYFEVLFGIAVRLFVRYGIALESHQQNTTLVLDPVTGDLRLLVKDFDGALINHDRLAAELGAAGPGPAEFADQRLLTRSDDELADVFITITVHLCAGAIAFGLARRGCAPLGEQLALIRGTLTGALDQYPGEAAAELLRARVLAADRLPGKAMVTAGTLVDKSRTGARDINKFIGTTGPNYLREPVR